MSRSLFLLHAPRIVPISRVELILGTLVVGRSSACGLMIPHLTISRRHAEIRITKTAASVRDLGSRNGTFVNGQRVDAAPLGLGTTLRFGDVSFLLTDNVGGDSSDESDIETARMLAVTGAVTGEVTAEEPIDVALLSKAQKRVLRLILEGLTEKEAAKRLSVSSHTVHNHVRDIYKILGVHTRLELYRRFRPGETP